MIRVILICFGIFFPYSLLFGQTYLIQDISIRKYLAKHPENRLYGRGSCVCPSEEGNEEEIDYEKCYCEDENGIINLRKEGDTIIATYENSSFVWKSTRVNNKQVKNVDYYFDPNVVFREIDYSDGKVWNVRHYDKGSTIMDSGTLKNGTGELYRYRQNSTIMITENYIEGVLNGLYKYHYSNGKLMMRGKYENGQKIGVWTEYNLEGNVVFSQEFFVKE